MSEKSSNPYDMDSPSFDSDRYLQKLLKVCLHIDFVSSDFYVPFVSRNAPSNK